MNKNIRFFSRTLFYRGYNGESPKSNSGILWLSTSKQYASNWGDKIAKFSIKDDLILCPTDKQLIKYLGVDPREDSEEYYDTLFHPSSEVISNLKADGYNSYYFRDDEYDCLILALFDSTIAELQ